MLYSVKCKQIQSSPGQVPYLALIELTVEIAAPSSYLFGLCVVSRSCFSVRILRILVLLMHTRRHAFQHPTLTTTMQPLVSSGKAWFCTVLSAFGIIILSFIAHLFNINHESMVGSINDPEDGKAVAKTVWGAVLVYVAFFAFCASQIIVYKRNAAGNRIALN